MTQVFVTVGGVSIEGVAMIRAGLERASEIYEYLFAPGKDVELFGMYDAENIGDEAMKVVGLATLPRGRTVATIKGTRLPVLNAMIAAKVRPQLVVGGGTLIHGGADDGSNFWLGVVQRFAAAGSRIAFMGTGISFYPEQLAENSPSAQGWRDTLSKAAYVGLRGPMSCAQAEQLGVSAEIFGDAAFGLHREGRAAETQRAARIMGLNFGECLGDQAAYEAINADMLRMLAADFHCRIYIVRPTDRASTGRIIRAAGVAADRIEIIEIFEDVTHYMESVSTCHAFVGVKLHAAGLALVTGVPSLLFEYRGKCRDFLLPIGMEHALIPMDSDAPSALGQVEALLARPEDYRCDARIGEIATRQRATIDRYFAS